jgi:hypothetical protein
MFGTRAHANKSSRQLAQNWKPFQQTEDEWKRSLFLIGGLASNDSTMNKDLHSLNQSGWPFAPRLHFAQVANWNRTTLELFREQIRCRDCVLNGQINSYTASR